MCTFQNMVFDLGSIDADPGGDEVEQIAMSFIETRSFLFAFITKALLETSSKKKCRSLSWRADGSPYTPQWRQPVSCVKTSYWQSTVIFLLLLLRQASRKKKCCYSDNLCLLFLSAEYQAGLCTRMNHAEPKIIGFCFQAVSMAAGESSVAK